MPLRCFFSTRNAQRTLPFDVQPRDALSRVARCVSGGEDVVRVVTQDFANFSLTNGSLTGVIWNDVNVDGVRDTDPATGEQRALSARRTRCRAPTTTQRSPPRGPLTTRDTVRHAAPYAST